MSKIVEKHITVTEETHDKLKQVAEAERRSMRTVVTMIIEDKYKKLKKDK